MKFKWDLISLFVQNNANADLLTQMLLPETIFQLLISKKEDPPDFKTAQITELFQHHSETSTFQSCQFSNRISLALEYVRMLQSQLTHSLISMFHSLIATTAEKESLISLMKTSLGSQEPSSDSEVSDSLLSSSISVPAAPARRNPATHIPDSDLSSFITLF